MLANTLTLEHIFAEVQTLSPDDKLRLVRQVIESLIPSANPAQPQYLVYGQFKDEHMSTDEDFVMAEWRPMEGELNGE